MNSSIIINGIEDYLLEGEQLLNLTTAGVFLKKSLDNHRLAGVLCITNYQILFFNQTAQTGHQFLKSSFGFLPEQLTLSIPLGLFSKITASTDNNKFEILIECKDVRFFKLLFVDENEGKRVHQHLIKFAFPDRITNCFAFFHKMSYKSLNGWELYSPLAEFERMGCTRSNNKWRITTVNNNYALCSTYSSVLVVPKAIGDDELAKVAAYRSKQRLPILTYIHKQNSTIFRCAQPMYGFTGTRCLEDEAYLEAIFDDMRHSTKKLRIFDCRPKLNAMAQKFNGAGFENTYYYINAEIEFLNIANIHMIRESFNRLSSLCEHSPSYNQRWFQSVESTGWLEHIHSVLVASYRIVETIVSGSSVVIHCSDGWDRTSQVCSLAQLMLDPYYRTLEGFAVLIEKDWISAGFQFAKRCGHSNLDDPNEISPIFLQFIDCVWQLQKQFPREFQFNEQFLLALITHTYSCRFGTFLYNSEKERKEAQAIELTESVWSLLCSQSKFQNPNYSVGHESFDDVIYPAVTRDYLELWTNFYLGLNRENLPKSESKSTSDSLLDALNELREEHELLLKTLENTKERCKKLEDQNDQLRDENQQLRDQLSLFIGNFEILLDREYSANSIAFDRIVFKDEKEQSQKQSKEQ